MAGGKAGGGRHVDERMRRVKAKGRPVTPEGVTQERGERIRRDVTCQDVPENRRPPPEKSCQCCKQEPDRPVGAELRERDEEVVEPAHPVVDDPALESRVERAYGAAP